jgi:protein-S-isoprenylcysteine O-methyltransferase Ste14
MDSVSAAYGPWPFVVFNSAIFIIVAFSFARPRTGRDWWAFGAFSAFVLALFTEMYGFPLTIYLLTAWFGSWYPSIAPFSHDAAHLWRTLLGLKGHAQYDFFHVVGNVLIVAGFFLLSAAWKVLCQAQREHNSASTGPYARVRHPQYVAFATVMAGFLFQWPTLPTLLVFPALLEMYRRLARREERDASAEFGDGYARYAAVTPGFAPRLLLRNTQTMPSFHGSEQRNIVASEGRG